MTGQQSGSPASTPDHSAPDRDLSLELIRVTEAAALAAGRWVGRGDKHSADQAAVDGMRHLLGTFAIDGRVVIGEGEKDHAPMLYNGERVGSGNGAACDVAVDPVDGTTLTARGIGNAVSVLAVSERGALFDPSAVFYMDKIATGPAAHVIGITAPVADNISAVAKATGKSVRDVTVVILDRPRHAELVAAVRASDRVIGAGIVGPSAEKLIAEAALAIELGADAADVGLTIHPHPTLSETVGMAAEVFEGTITDLYLPKPREEERHEPRSHRGRLRPRGEVAEEAGRGFRRFRLVELPREDQLFDRSGSPSGS